MPCAKKPKEITWLDKARFIAHYAIDGCSTTLKVYVETFAAADTKLVLGIVNTSPEDFTRFLLRPKGARTERHGIKGLGRNEAAAEEDVLVDTAKLAADTIHEISGWHLPTWTEAGDAFYELLKPALRGAYYLLLANVTEDFAFDWYSGILLAPESKCSIGRFATIGGTVKVTSFPYEVIPQSQFLYPMINAHTDRDGVYLEQGLWCVIIDIVAGRRGPADDSGTILGKLMVGQDDGTQCGTVMVLDFPAGTFQVFKKFIRKVGAPDLIRMQMALHLNGIASNDIDYGCNIEAFRLR